MAVDRSSAAPVSVLERGLRVALAGPVRVQWFTERSAELGTGAVFHGVVTGADDPATAAAAARAGEDAAAAAEAAALEDEAWAAEAARVRREARDAAWRVRMRAEADAARLAMALPESPGSSASSWVAAAAAVPTTVSDPVDVLDLLRASERDLAVAEARRLAVVVTLVGAESSPSSVAERHKAAEIAAATGMSHLSAETLIHRARMLTGPFDAVGALLATGGVSLPHCLVLISQCASITDPDLLAAIADAALPHIGKVPSAFRTQVDAIITALDPDATARRARARDERRVYTRRGKDGMSFLGLTHQTHVIDQIHAQLTADADTLHTQRTADRAAAERPDDDGGTNVEVDADAAARGASLTDGDLSWDACRADALAARVLGHHSPDCTLTLDPVAPTAVTVEVVIDLDTLNGLADHACLLNGDPVPAATAREWASMARFFRRVITDPVTGHLLDYGDRTYLPDPVRRHCFARDGGCREPSCTRRAIRFLQLDHAQEHPDGPSSVANCGALCTSCHHRKTLGLTDITQSAADGTATLSTAWGQTIRIPARPYLPPPPRPAPPPAPLDEPPF